ncbi:hypothetical protein A2715_03520 [Candidatus Woesebacteria bacterium RIFCSPHIGHO2_01_FULL_39_32]|uniref:Uncharacterized protein n=1 Tax=Candidatus Woesebacteria bacterium RIFCSPLOWO2_01_FULL_39_25 TaxID=1802521 RepID=A0A1F8BMS5_9BACT|nr:MAG: hypothetical protein A2124_04825 [Candidatus Woesebacteria bacterium GWB1_37_5]OGM24809.1 MAG: hypothetical protein A2715_03520 [Candidatus Woesebacteria bacterium RIFCSPHIGHO2_01_FULL_39_32]OGM37130.1 MAG: hypothetical protein A3F01_05460 [Candidatus Woesebacteria bacterium RIFCSPHIGHO2_12_FULL_38_11]OGM64635.1 MAG: hypothetical protein A2893_06435 [Candidatus Woesebacteria bacterium RIFCSPLOWO2_01_FULL_39_25]
MEIKKFFKKFFGLKYRYRLPVIYIILILLGFATMLVPLLNECSGGIFVICAPISLAIIILLSIPGKLLVDFLSFIVPESYYSWATHSKNLFWVVLISYAATLILLFFVGLLVDKVRQIKSSK